MSVRYADIGAPYSPSEDYPDHDCSPLDCQHCGAMTCRDREAPMLIAPRAYTNACTDADCPLCQDQCKRPLAMLAEVLP